jgi:hypothetical protein
MNAQPQQIFFAESDTAREQKGERSKRSTGWSRPERKEERRGKLGCKAKY